MSKARYAVYLSVNEHDTAAMAELKKCGYAQIDIFRIGLKTLLLQEANKIKEVTKDEAYSAKSS